MVRTKHQPLRFGFVLNFDIPNQNERQQVNIDRDGQRNGYNGDGQRISLAVRVLPSAQRPHRYRPGELAKFDNINVLRNF